MFFVGAASTTPAASAGVTFMAAAMISVGNLNSACRHKEHADVDKRKNLESCDSNTVQSFLHLYLMHAAMRIKLIRTAIAGRPREAAIESWTHDGLVDSLGVVGVVADRELGGVFAVPVLLVVQ